jgi:hypothetical protein
MHHQPRSESEVAARQCGGYDPLVSKGASPRHALHRTARKHGIAPKHLSALIAQANHLAGDQL